MVVEWASIHKSELIENWSKTKDLKNPKNIEPLNLRNMYKFNIENAEYQNDYKIFLAFDDGIKGIVDLKDFIFDKKCGVFKRLQNREQFKNFTVEQHTLVWGDDLDLAPEFLHDLITK